jgi:hypothetical protein
VTEKQHAHDYANQIFTHVSHEHADMTDLGLYLARVIAELLELSPVAREHVSDLILVELTEELHRRGWPGRNAARMVGEVQRDWSREA